MTNHSKTTRRALLGSASALAAVGAVPPAVTEAAESDPVLDVVARCRTLLDEQVTAWVRLSDANSREQEGERPSIVLEYPEFDFVDLKPPEGEIHMRLQLTGRMVTDRADNFRTIEARWPRNLDKTARAAWIAEKTAELKAAMAAHDAQHDHLRLAGSRAYEAAERADDALDAAVEELIHTRPATLAGTAAVVAFAADFVKQADENDNDRFLSGDRLAYLLSGLADVLDGEDAR